MSSHASNRARVIPLRPATADPAATARPAAAGRVAATGRAGDGPAPVGPTPEAARREPLWRHVVGEVLRGRRLAQGRTLRQVADAARISMPYLSEVERGRKEASSEVLAAAAGALGLRLADLLALTHAELTRVDGSVRDGVVDGSVRDSVLVESVRNSAPDGTVRGSGLDGSVRGGGEEAGDPGVRSVPSAISLARPHQRRTATRPAPPHGEVRLAA
ncbi:helix-turn-helix domain-containing protein [Streptomyces tsukubensis]|uniref:HTH cro/C1-type domain-containing protein n=1 Tax=Streptomyces tsukubensis TaxID=83656 RepID=A0A1V4ACM4_9ACTN|nr:hypothetical protein B1H18_09030 [Streptomyces tsukubensis]QFR95427.1 helix-turn-helix domain-containing protein [Streptomyces tsukubensis]